MESQPVARTDGQLGLTAIDTGFGNVEQCLCSRRRIDIDELLVAIVVIEASDIERDLAVSELCLGSHLVGRDLLRLGDRQLGRIKEGLSVETRRTIAPADACIDK